MAWANLIYSFSQFRVLQHTYFLIRYPMLSTVWQCESYIGIEDIITFKIYSFSFIIPQLLQCTCTVLSFERYPKH